MWAHTMADMICDFVPATKKESKQKCELEWTILKLDNYDKGKTAWLAAQIFWRYKWRSNSG